MENADVSGSENVQTKQIKKVQAAKSYLRRKLSLYNGTEKLSDLGVPSHESNRAVVRRALQELRSSPIVTHVVFRDRKGREWKISRATSFIERLKIQLLAN